MKKIIFIIIVLCINCLNVEAYSEINKKSFQKIMENMGYDTAVTIEDVNSMKIIEDGSGFSERYRYNSFNTEEEAKSYISDLYEENKNQDIIDSYEINQFSTSDSNYFSYEWFDDLGGATYFVYYFRYKKSVVYGTTATEYKDNIKNTINELFKDREQEDEIEEYDEPETNNEVTTIGQTTTKPNNTDISKLILIGVLFVSFLVLLIIYIIKRNKKTD